MLYQRNGLMSQTMSHSAQPQNTDSPIFNKGLNYIKNKTKMT